MPNLNKSRKGMYPAPVYVAEFADGSTGRMSFWSQEGKPFDFARGRRLVAWAYRELVPVRVVGQFGSWDDDHETREWCPSRPIIAGHVEHDGRRYADTLDAPKVVRIPAKRLAADALALLERGDTAAAIAALRSIAA